MTGNNSFGSVSGGSGQNSAAKILLFE